VYFKVEAPDWALALALASVALTETWVPLLAAAAAPLASVLLAATVEVELLAAASALASAGAHSCKPFKISS
jgi:hypothetical protein